MSNSLFISTVSAKQMAREAEINVGIIRELRQLLETEREQNAVLKAKVAAAKAAARCGKRRRQRQVAKLRAALCTEHKDYEELGADYDRIWTENRQLKSGLEKEKHDAQRMWDNYNETYDAWAAMRSECDTLLARCEEREAEIGQLRERNADLNEKIAVEQDQVAYFKNKLTEPRERSAAEIAPFLPHAEVVKHLRALGYSEPYLRCGPLDFEWRTLMAQKLNFHVRLLRGFPAADEGEQEERYIRGATDSQLRGLMQHVGVGELLPGSASVTPLQDEEDAELNWIRQHDPTQMTLDPELMRRFLLRWRHHHKRLPGGYRVSDLD